MISVAEKNPGLVAEWDESNELTPDRVSYGSNKMIIWRGKCGHRWDAPPKARNGGEGCPYCAGKRVLIGFNDLKSQYPLLAEEWSSANEFTPDKITGGSDKRVEWICRECGHTWNATVKNRVYGSHCPNCAGRVLTPGKNDFASLHPELMLDWSNRNDDDPDLHPSEMPEFSNRRVWWKCHTCGYEWQSQIADRSRGAGCPCCVGQVRAQGINDLSSARPDVALEWSDKNGDLSPSDFNTKSRTMIWWVCGKCGFEWKASIYNRCHGKWNGCPACRKKKSKEHEAGHRRKIRKARQYELHYEEYAVDRWIEENSIMVKRDTDELIGVPVDYYFPEYNSVLILPKPFHVTYHGRKIQRAINDLLRKKKIRLVRILDAGMEPYDGCICVIKDNDSLEAVDKALAEAGRNLSK